MAEDQPVAARTDQPNFVVWLVLVVVVYAVLLAASVVLLDLYISSGEPAARELAALWSAMVLLVGLPTWLMVGFLGWRYRQPNSELSVATFRILAVVLALPAPSFYAILGVGTPLFVVAAQVAAALVIPLPSGGFGDPGRRLRRE